MRLYIPGDAAAVALDADAVVAAVKTSADRRNSIDLLIESSHGRLPQLVPIRHGRTGARNEANSTPCRACPIAGRRSRWSPANRSCKARSTA